jgi:hypothetical protein
MVSNAQSREALEDSVIVGGISHSMIEMLLGTGQMNADDRLLVHWSYAELIKEVAREHLDSFSDEELRTILAYFRTDGYGFMVSDMFFQAYLENIEKAFQSEMASGPYFSTFLKDARYGAGLKPLFQNMMVSLDPVVDGILGEEGREISNAKRSGLGSGYIDMLRESAQKVQSSLFNIYRVTLLDYLSKEDVKAVEDFVLSPVGKKYADYVMTVNSAVGFASEESVNEFLAEVQSKKINTYQQRTSVADYVALSRQFSSYFPELYRPHAEIKSGSSVYEGQTRDMLPYGNGRLTDKKGVVYEGNFKDGLRHGLMKVTKPGKQPVMQFWISDEYRKEVPTGADKTGALKPPYIEEGMRFGYGVYGDDRKSRYLGTFIDGKLNGRCKVYEPGRTEEGEFADGRMVEGYVILTSDKAQTVTFKGKMAGALSRGVREIVLVDGSRKEVHTGLFRDGMLEGEGHRIVEKKNDVLESSGVFAYGRLYGEGVQKRDVTYNNGINESSVYEGGFYSDSYHGTGRLVLDLSDIPSGQHVLTRAGVALPEFSYSSSVVIIEGSFDGGNFVEGKMTFSDGTWYEGKFSPMGLIQGTMRCKVQDGAIYLGACSNGVPHGAGELYNADGSVFKGMFDYGAPVQVQAPPPPPPKNAVRFDELTYEYNHISAGYGKATLIKPAGVKIMVRTNVTRLKVVCNGRFRGDNLIEGKVTMSDGTWLEGVFEDGILIQGRGKTVDKYRVVYEGDIKNGYPHGNGKCYYNDGTWFEGKFAWGSRMGGTHYSATGEVIKVYK